MSSSRVHKDETDPRFLTYETSHDPVLRDEILEDYWWIVSYVARRYQGRGEPMDDISQVAALGVIAAIERFNPHVGSSFPAFAIPTALGEVRRHFRDKTWRVRVPRRIKDLTVQISGVVEELMSDLGRAPTAAELADRLNVTSADIREAWEATAASRPISADSTGFDSDEGPSVIDLRAIRNTPDPHVLADDRILIQDLLRSLPQRGRQVVVLRFFEGLSQAEVAERIGISQPHVSRLLRASLEDLRQKLSESQGE